MMEEVENNEIVDVECPIEVDPPIKRKRGRPKKVPNLEISNDATSNDEHLTNKVKSSTKTVENSSVETNRIAGRMSLRPNRRVDVRKGTRELNELIGDDGSDVDMSMDNDDDNDFRIDENAEPNFEIPTPSFLQEQNFFVNEDSNDNSGVPFASKRRGKRRIAFASQRLFPYHPPTLTAAEITSVNDVSDLPEKTFDINKEHLCVGCAKELQVGTLQGYRNIYKDLTTSGKSLYDLLCSIIKDEISGATCGSLLCIKCYNSLNQIENIYQQFRRATDTFLDTYILGHKTIAADLAGVKTLDEAQIFFNKVDFNDCILVIVDDNLSNLNPLSVGPGRHFNCTFEHAYRGCVTDSDNIPKTCHELTPCDGEATITITFDYSTGIIEKALSLNVAEISKPDLRAETSQGTPLFYMTKSEFQSLPRYVGGKKVYLSKTDASQLDCILLLGKKAHLGPIALSTKLSARYKKKALNCDQPFNCLDCGSSYRVFHLLTNHVQVLHKGPADEIISAQTSMTLSTSETVANKNDPNNLSRPKKSKLELEEADDGPTLEKPFQCEFCGKCFTHYQNMSNHSDHYHGFKRSCNIEGCEVVSTSIQQYVQHYVGHADSSFVLPEEFEEKKKVELPCPLCNIHIQGLWKFFQHTYIHDAQPRFKCPVCPKRTHKVQNFKDHMTKHFGPGFSKLRTCRHCKKEVVSSDLLLHIKEHHASRHVCDVCDLAFSSDAKLIFHKEKHLPKARWQVQCQMCDNVFPSEIRLKLHVASVHGSVNLDCQECGQVFANRNLLSCHMASEHEESVALFQCLACNKREISVMAARKHYRMEHRDKPFTCFTCKSVFDTENELHRHLTGEHPEIVGDAPMTDNSADFPCIFCKKLFNKSLLRLRHIRFYHLVEAIEVKENVAVTEDHIAEFEPDTGGVVRLHTIP